MPIFASSPISVFDQDAFHAVDKVVTGCAFAVHNELGRYLDERLYQVELAARLQEHKLTAEREMQITLALDDFRREYFVDLFVNGGVIIETKAVEAFVPAHRAQVLNYLYLCGLHHATLLNFQAERVQHEFVSTRLTPALRRQVAWECSGWKPLCKGCELLLTTLRRLLEDWGCALDPVLYREALIHFLGGEAEVLRQVEVVTAHGIIGSYPVYQLADDVAFYLTTSVHRPHVVLEHLRRLLQHTRLRALQWINLNRQTVSLQTLEK